MIHHNIFCSSDFCSSDLIGLLCFPSICLGRQFLSKPLVSFFFYTNTQAGLLILLPSWHWERKSCNKIYNEFIVSDIPVYASEMFALLRLEGCCLRRDFNYRHKNLKAWFKVAGASEKENGPLCVLVKWNYKYHFMKTECSNMFWYKRWLSPWNPKAPQLFIWMEEASVGCFLECDTALRKLCI